MLVLLLSLGGLVGAASAASPSRAPSPAPPPARSAGVDDTFWPDASGRVESYGELVRQGLVVGRTGRVLVHGDSASALAALPDVADVVRLPGGLLRVTPAAGVDDLALARALRAVPGVAWAHPDLLLSPRIAALPDSPLPDDPLLADEWHLENTGQGGRTAGVDINAALAWEYASGAGQQIAVIDSGVQVGHPDLSLIPGHDYVDGDDDPSPDPADAWEGPHGTCVSGVAAAIGDNGYGVAGVAWDADVYGIRLIGGATSLEDLYDAFVEAVDAGSGVLSNSWGWSDTCASISNYGTFDDMFDYAEEQGRGGLGSVVVFAAGNGGCDIAADQMLAHRKLIVVAAVESNDVRASYSNFGDSVDIAAPTTLLTTDMVGGGYGSYGGDDAMVDGFNGTSASTPVVSGVVALMMEANPRISATQIRNALCATATRIDVANAGYDSEGWSPYYGCGRIDAGAAVAAVANVAPQAPSPTLTGGDVYEGRALLAWTAAEDADHDVLGYDVAYWVDGEDEESAPTTWVTGTSLELGDLLAAGTTVSWKVRAEDPWGAGDWSETTTFTVLATPEEPIAEAPTEEEPGGCSTGSGSAGPWWLAAGLMLARRARTERGQHG